jgi:hypothetical protein
MVLRVSPVISPLRSQMGRAWTISEHIHHHGNGCQDHKHRREAVNAEGASGGAFRCKDQRHVADGDDGFRKQDDADPAEVAPRHERQQGHSRRDVTNTLEAKPPSDVGAVFRKRQAETACRGRWAHDILGADRDNRESQEECRSRREPMHDRLPVYLTKII